MNILQTIILGIVEGITEFLPISSTFHLIWTSRLLTLAQSDFVKLFEVFIQSGAILAVFVLFWKDIVTNKKNITNLIASFIPTALVGFVLYKVIKGVFFEQIFFTTIVFILVGIVFILVEKGIQKNALKINKSLQSLTLTHALYIGFFQALAVVPGVSRAGAVLVGMMFLGYKRTDSAKYSFMLAVPTIFAASAFDLISMRHVLSAQSGAIGSLIMGSLVALVSAYMSVRWLIGYLQKHSLELFGWYRIGVGIILLLALVA